MPILSLVFIRNKINQPLSRQFHHLSPYATKSTNHSLAHSITCLHTQQNQPATLSPIPSLVSIRNKINHLLSCLVLSSPILRQRVTFRSMQYLMLGPVKPSRKAEKKGNLWIKKSIIVFYDLNILLPAAGHIQHIAVQTALHQNKLFLIFCTNRIV
jgi:hypothetical protein